MDYQVLFNIALGIVAFLGGWVLNNVSKSIERLDLDVRNMPGNYVSKTDFRDTLRDLKDDMRHGFDGLSATLNTLSSKLDHKEDKP